MTNKTTPTNGDRPTEDRIEVLMPFTGERRTMQSRGVGAYPYDCHQKDACPDAIIYSGGGAWVANVELEWSEVDKCYAHLFHTCHRLDCDILR